MAAEHTDLIMALAIDELGGVLRQGYFDLPSTVEEATEQWFHYADLVLMWLDDGGLERHAKDKPLTCLALFTRFKNYAIGGWTTAGTGQKYRNGFNLLIKHRWMKMME